MARSPKYLKKERVTENQLSVPEKDPLLENARVNLFLDSRKGEGKKQAGELWYFLWSKETEFDWEWIPLATIEKHMQESCNISRNRLIQLLKDMEKDHLIRKKTVIDLKLKTPNKERTFYKFQHQAISPVKTDAGYKKGYIELSLENSDLRRKFDSAMNVLNKHRLLQDYFKDYFDERPRPDVPKEAVDATAKLFVSEWDPKARKKMEYLLQIGYGKDEIDVIKRCIDEMKERMDKDPGYLLCGPIIVRK